MVPYSHLFHCSVSLVSIVKLFKSSVCGRVGREWLSWNSACLARIRPCFHPLYCITGCDGAYPQFQHLGVKTEGSKIQDHHWPHSKSNATLSYLRPCHNFIPCKKELNILYSILLLGSFQSRLWFCFWLLFLWGFLYICFILFFSRQSFSV